MKQKPYARCKACDKAFYPMRIGEEFEDMCGVCLDRVHSQHSTDEEFALDYAKQFIEEKYSE